jgi:hypothetical protein
MFVILETSNKFPKRDPGRATNFPEFENVYSTLAGFVSADE